MPSIEQCDAAAGNVAALPSTLEIFDKFKPASGNCKDSDSEESFHLVLDDDDIENQSVVSNGRDKEIHGEETEDDILNKFETLPSGTPDQMDSQAEDIILNDPDDDVYPDQKYKPEICKNENITSNIKVNFIYGFDDYEDSGDGEFKSVYEMDETLVEEASKEATETKEETMDVSGDEQTIVDDSSKKVDNQVIEPLNNMEDSMEVEQEDICPLENQDVAMEETSDNNCESTETSTPMTEEINIPNTQDSSNTFQEPKEELQDTAEASSGTPEVPISEPIDATPPEKLIIDENSNSNKEDSLLKELDETIQEPEEIKAKNQQLFKVPEEIPKTSQEKDSPDDEIDLLDISMVRETEEDDACAIADAIEESTEMENADKETQANEKSDEEQSEKVETEQEGSDVDKDNDNAMGFDDLDEDSRLEDDVEAKISESSKDSSSENTKDSTTEAPVSEDATTKIADDNEKVNVEEAPVSEDNIESSDISKTDEDSNKAKEDNDDAPEEVLEDTASNQLEEEEDVSDKRKSSLNKRSHSANDADGVEISAKKPKLASETSKPEETHEQPASTVDLVTPTEKVNTLTSFSKFMQCRKFTSKLSRTDLEQFCIQKICESLMLKSAEGELHQSIKKHEKTIDNLRRDLQQLTKQCKDLEVVNRKLITELKMQSSIRKPLVPLKITRSVGLQVRLNPGNEVNNQNRRRPMTTTPQKQIINSSNSPAVNRVKANSGNMQQSSAVRQVMQTSPQKSPLTAGQTTTAPMLSQALQKRPAIAKRTSAPARKSVDASKPGVIDLTDEDDRLAQVKSPAIGNTIKIINKTVNSGGTSNKGMSISKMSSGGKALVTQGKQVAMSKTVTVGANKGSSLSQGLRLTPASVITSSANGSPQMLYVVPTITSNAAGQQKVAFVNFQPTNGIIPGTLNGSTVSVMSNKQGQTLTLKTVSSPLRLKHPAPLPTPPRINLDPKLKPLLPKPQLTIKKIDTGIILQWKMPYNLDLYESIVSYQLYAYQETSAPPSTDMWRKVGDVKALALPMACTLTQFADKNKYYFAVRSVDVHKRIGAFSDPEEISL